MDEIIRISLAFERGDYLSRILLEDIGVEYRNSQKTHRVLNNINLSICEGEYISIVGKSGSGKTTLLNVMGGLLGPSYGKLFINDNEIRTMKERSRFKRKYVSFIFQFFNLLPTLNVEENICIQHYLFGKKISMRKLNSLISYLGLENCRNKLPGVLSGGEQQRVAIARSVFSESKFIFADEPTHSLDQESANRVMGLFGKINRVYGRTLVIVTHDLEVAQEADRQLKICDGNIVYANKRK